MSPLTAGLARFHKRTIDRKESSSENRDKSKTNRMSQTNNNVNKSVPEEGERGVSSAANWSLSGCDAAESLLDMGYQYKGLKNVIKHIFRDQPYFVGFCRKEGNTFKNIGAVAIQDA